MLPWGQQVEQDVVLRADTHKASYVVKILLEHIVAVDGSVASRWAQHTR